MRSQVPWLPIALLGTALAGPAGGVPIDTFEVAPFSQSLTFSGTDILFNSVSANGHCIDDQRIVTLTYPAGTTGTLSADLTLGDPDDAVDISFPTGGASVWLQYDGGPWDLTASGAAQQVLVRTEQPGPAGGVLTVFLTDSDGMEANVAASYSGSTTYHFPFSAFTGVDPTKIVLIDVIFSSTNPGTWSVADIRTAALTHLQVDWDVLRDYIEICPVCPPDPCTFDWDIFTNPPLMVMGPEITIGATGPGLELIRFDTFDSGGDLGIGGPVGAMNMLWMSSGPFTKATLTFDVRFPASMGFNPALSGPPGLLAPPDDGSPPADDEGIAMTAPVIVTDDAGRILGSTVQTLLITSASGQLVDIQNVTVMETYGRASATGYQVRFDLEAVQVDEAGPLLEVYAAGDWTAGTWPTAAPMATATAGGEGLRALPTVSRDRTTLELARAAESPGAIEIYDVRGRLSRRLPVTAGARSATWDGRDDAGAPVASGVYLARWSAGGAAAAAARIIRLR